MRTAALITATVTLSALAVTARLRAQAADGDATPPLAAAADAPPATASGVFEAPKKYGIERYMPGWERNPFSTPTPPTVPPPTESVFKDMGYTSIYGPKDSPTFTVINTRTNERFKLSLNAPAKNGMSLKSFSLGEGRRDATLEVALGTETATLTYAKDYVKQASAQPGARPGGVPGAPGMPGGPGNGVIPRPGGVPGTAGAQAGNRTPITASAPPGATVGVPGGAMRNIPLPGSAPAAAAPTVVGAPPVTRATNQATVNVGGGATVISTNTAPATTGGAPVINVGTPTVGAPVQAAPGAPQRRRLIN